MKTIFSCSPGQRVLVRRIDSRGRVREAYQIGGLNDDNSKRFVPASQLLRTLELRETR